MIVIIIFEVGFTENGFVEFIKVILILLFEVIILLLNVKLEIDIVEPIITEELEVKGEIKMDEGGLISEGILIVIVSFNDIGVARKKDKYPVKLVDTILLDEVKFIDWIIAWLRPVTWVWQISIS